jgi:hypothetical protein
MSEFKVGMDVKVTDVVNMYGVKGEVGYILAKAMGNGWIVKVLFPDTQSDTFTLSEGQMTPAKLADLHTAQPAVSATAADGEFVPGVFVTVNGEELPLAEYDKRFGVVHGFLPRPEKASEYYQRIINRAYVADHVATGDFDSVWEIIEALREQLAAVQTRIAWADEILDMVESTAPKDWAGSTDPLPHDWYHAGQLVREYRAEYATSAPATAAGEGGTVTRAELDRALQAGVAAADRALALKSEQDAVRVQLDNMIFNLKQQPDMKRITDSLESIMDSVGWDKS